MHTKISRLFTPLLAVTIGATALLLPAKLQAVTVRTVINPNDAGAGSLRQAVADSVSGDVVAFNVTGTITLTSGNLVVNKGITISGPGARKLTVKINGGSVF